MVRTIVVFVFVTSVCVTAAFSQTVEKENKVDVQKKNSSTEVSGRLLLETKDIEPKLPDMEVKKKAAVHAVIRLDTLKPCIGLISLFL